MAKSRMAFFSIPGRESIFSCLQSPGHLSSQHGIADETSIFVIKSISLLHIGNGVLEHDVEAAPLNMLEYNNDGYTCVKFGTPQG
jgi:hypothetical protein